MIYIRKSGVFYENEYNPDADEYVFTKVESFIPYLSESIHIDSEITIEDFFDILKKDEEIVDIIFGSHMGHFPLRPYFDEIKQECMDESKEEMEYIECSWVIEHFDYKVFYEKFKDKKTSTRDIFGPLREPDGDEVNEITEYIDVYGWGQHIPHEDDIYEDGNDPPTHASYAIEFLPLYRIKHLPIKLNKNFVMREEKYDNKDHIIMSGEKDFSVFEVFGAILSEITFAGLPEERDNKWNDVVDRVDEYKEKMDDEEDNSNDDEIN